MSKKIWLKRYLASLRQGDGNNCPHNAILYDGPPPIVLTKSVLQKQESNNDKNGVVDKFKCNDTRNVVSSSSLASNQQKQCRIPTDKRQKITHSDGYNCPDNATSDESPFPMNLTVSGLRKQESNNDKNNTVDKSKYNDTRNVVPSSSLASNQQKQCRIPIDKRQEITHSGGYCPDAATSDEIPSPMNLTVSVLQKQESNNDKNNIVDQSKCNDTRNVVPSLSLAGIPTDNRQEITHSDGYNCLDNATSDESQSPMNLTVSVLQKQESNNDDKNDIVDKSKRNDTRNVVPSPSLAKAQQEQCHTPTDIGQEITHSECFTIDNGCDNPSVETEDRIGVEADSSSSAESEASGGEKSDNEDRYAVESMSTDVYKMVPSTSRASKPQKRRRRTSNDEPQFACAEAGCHKKCKTASGLMRHVNIVHCGEKIHACLSSGCDERFRTLVERDEHIKSNHPNAMIHSCELCPLSFRHRNTFITHMYKEHWDKLALGEERLSHYD